MKFHEKNIAQPKKVH